MNDISNISINGTNYNISNLSSKNIFKRGEWTDTGLIWVDGKKIFCRVFYGSFARDTIMNGSEKIDTLISTSGMFQYANHELDIFYSFPQSGSISTGNRYCYPILTKNEGVRLYIMNNDEMTYIINSDIIFYATLNE